MPLPKKGQSSWAEPLNAYLMTAAGEAAAEATQEALLAQVAAETARAAAEAARDESEGYVAQQQTLAEIDTPDELVATLVSDTGSATGGALATAVDTRAVSRGELVLNVADYGVIGNNTAQDLSALNAAIVAASTFGGVGVYFPRPTNARYLLTQPLPAVAGLRVFADTMQTILRWTAGNMLSSPTATLQKVYFDDITLENIGAAGHMIELGATGSLVHCVFTRCEIKPRATGTSFIHMDGNGNFFGIRFRDCQLWRQPTHAVPFLDVRSSSAGLNSCSVQGGQWHSQECDTSPFWRVESTAASSYASNFSFHDIIGEQNLGGMIHIRGVNGVEVRNVRDFDTSAAKPYTDDLFKFDVSSTGLSPQGVVIDNSGTNGVAGFASGKSHLMIGGTGSGHDIGRVTNAGTQLPVLNLPARGRRVRHGGGEARGYSTTAVNLVLGALDYMVVCTGAAVTVTLPDPAALMGSGTVPVGREYVLKNTHANPTTVICAGASVIDGQATRYIDQGETLRVVSDGTNWQVAGQSGAAGARVATTATLNGAANAINTRNKAAGREVFNTTLNRPVWATGSTATSTWVFGDGTTAHTPT